MKPDLSAGAAAPSQWWGYGAVCLISLNASSFPCNAEVTVKRSACLLQQVSRRSAVSVGLLNTQGGLVVLRSTEAGACREGPRSQGAFRLVASHIHLRSVQGLSEINPPPPPRARRTWCAVVTLGE